LIMAAGRAATGCFHTVCRIFASPESPLKNGRF